MLNNFLRTKAGTTAIGLAIAAVVYFVPEAKPIACGAGFALPFALNG